MTNAELIRKIKAEIERRKKEIHATVFNDEFDDLLRFLDTLESETTISPWKKIHTYTEELHEGDMEKMCLELSVGKGEKRTKIALPDRIVDILESEKQMNQDDDFRGEMRGWVELMVAASFPEQDGDFISEEDYRSVIKQTARHFAQWQKEQDDKELSDLLTIAHLQGADQMKEQMLKEAVEGEVYLYHSYNRDATAILVDLPKENLDDKVRVIVIKEDEK